MEASKPSDDSFANILIEQLPALRRYACALLRDPAAADDLVQDCIERALNQSSQLKDRNKLASWLRSILHNLYVDQFRRKRSRGLSVTIHDLENDPALSLAPQDRSELGDVVRAVNGLSFEHRQILLLVGLEELSYREIAEELSIPIGTVMSRLSRARDLLRHALESGGARH